MLTNVYAFYDEKAEVHLTPFFMQNDVSAIRAFQQLLMDKNTQLGKYPNDFKLYRLGVFNDNNGHIESLTFPEMLIQGTSLLEFGNVN